MAHFRFGPLHPTVDASEIVRAPVEGKVVEIRFFTTGFILSRWLYNCYIAGFLNHQQSVLLGSLPAPIADFKNNSLKQII